MNSEEIHDAVLAYFSEKQPTPAPTAETRYLDQGIIDSLGIVELITEFESRFGIQFTAEDLQSPEFQTIGGLIQIVQHRAS